MLLLVGAVTVVIAAGVLAGVRGLGREHSSLGGMSRQWLAENGRRVPI
jgi:hypothetical protein